MPKEQKRDNEYYKEQLKSRFPLIYADLRAGKFSSLNKALIAAGIKRKRTPLQELNNAWKKATPVEQRQFLRDIGHAAGTVAAASSPVGGASSRPITVDKKLEKWAVTRIETIMTKRGMKMGEVMAELGLKKLNPSLGQAMRNGTRLNQRDLIKKLEIWLAKNASV